MENCWDFLEWLGGSDACTSVFMLLDDPANLVRVSAVSRSWRHFACNTSKNVEVGSSSALEWDSLEREHPSAVCPSSTDNYPDESIGNTLEPDESVNWRPSSWSSGGQTDPGMRGSLTYRLTANLCVVNEIKIQPFKASRPIYLAKFVCFRLGARLRQGTGVYIPDGYEEQQLASDDNYNWTYVSPEFPMKQENILQSFKLPRPVICIGGMLQIELTGRVQMQAEDGLYHKSVCHVQAMGSPLSPIFDVDIHEASRSMVLKYFPESKSSTLPKGTEEAEVEEMPHWHSFRARLMNLGVGRGSNEEDDYEDASDDYYFAESPPLNKWQSWRALSLASLKY